jgi:hypothetical protein
MSEKLKKILAQKQVYGFESFLFVLNFNGKMRKVFMKIELLALKQNEKY